MKRKRYLIALLAIELANFLAQIPYFLHQYHHSPSVIGTFLMATVFAWFLIGFLWLWRGMKKGYVLTMVFLVVELLFYLSTQITQAISGKGILLHVLHPDDIILFIVFGIGYINLVAAAFFIFYLLTHKYSLIKKGN